MCTFENNVQLRFLFWHDTASVGRTDQGEVKHKRRSSRMILFGSTFFHFDGVEHLAMLPFPCVLVLVSLDSFFIGQSA